jgi:pimeloyl-ACP methyl ester carboxylesterase
LTEARGDAAVWTLVIVCPAPQAATSRVIVIVQTASFIDQTLRTGMSFGFTPSHRGGSGPPLVCLHGFTDTWRTWELVLPELERHHDVLAPTLLGHTGAQAVNGTLDEGELLDAAERAMDEAGFDSAHIVGNSLGGYAALKLAERGRARSVVALAPAGGWADGDDSYRQTLEEFRTVHAQAKAAAPHADTIAANPRARRMATQRITTNYEHIPPDLVAHMICGTAGCTAVEPLIELALRDGWTIVPERITCPVRVAWGTEDQILPWPRAAARYRDQLPHADWVDIAGAGHCPQLDVPLETAQLILGFTTAR